MRNPLHLLGVAVACSLACSCAQRWGSVGPFPKPEAYPDAAAVVLVDEHDIDYHLISGRAVADEHVHRVVLALRSDAKLPEQLFVSYNRTFSQVLSARARIVLPDGSSGDVDETPIDQPYFSSWALYQDGRVLRIPLPPVPAGGALETDTTVRWLDPRLFPQRASLTGDWPVKWARVKASAPSDWSLEWMAREWAEPLAWEPTVARVGGDTRYTWEAHDLPALVSETGGLPADEARRLLEIRLSRWAEGGRTLAAFQNPRELSAWDYALSSTSVEPSDEMRQVVANVVREEQSNPERVARRLYDFAATQVQYCALELGIGGWKPHAAKEVFSLRYGDCKDKANLLRTLLALADIQSDPILVYSHHGFPHPFELAAPAANFNHEILEVHLPGGSLLADPTSRTVPFGELPFNDSDAPILPVAADGRDLRQSPAIPPEGNEETLEVELSERGAAAFRGSFVLASKGAPAASLRERLMSAPNSHRTSAEVLQEWLAWPRSQVREVNVGPEGKGPLRVEGQVDARPVKAVDKTWLLRPSDALPAWLAPLPGTARKGPYVTPYRKSVRLELTVALPRGASVGELPAPVDLKTDLGRYRLVWSKDSSRLKLERSLVLQEHVVAAARYPDLKAFHDAALAAEVVPVVVHLP